MRLKGKTAIVTGGAAGLGKATVDYLLENGANVGVLDKRPYLDSHPSLCAVTGDITDTKEVKQALETIVSRLGPIRICVNCAGVLGAKRLVGREGPMPLTDFNHIIQVNLVGTFNVMRLVAAQMMVLPALTLEDGLHHEGQNQETGVIINTASISAYEGQIGQVAYAASKAGVMGLTLPSARELGKHGIRVMAIAPGVFDTAMLTDLPTPAREQLISDTPFPKRLGNPLEFAKLVSHIVENPMLNGEIIRLDGGLRIQVIPPSAAT